MERQRRASQAIIDVLDSTSRYNFHSHSEFCDGRAPISEIVASAYAAGMEAWGVSPHSPICVDSPCNMSAADLPIYFERMSRLKEEYSGRMQLFTGLEIDYMSRDFGPHIDWFRALPLDFCIGSVHFVPDRKGKAYDCDGSVERFSRYLAEGFGGDLRYVVEKYFAQVMEMIELGGFDILGHFDKIIGNASAIDPEIEESGWYESLIDEVVRLAGDSGVVVEINTKAIETRKRYYPAERWWEKLISAGVPIAVNSDCHDPALVDIGRQYVLSRIARR